MNNLSRREFFMTLVPDAVNSVAPVNASNVSKKETVLLGNLSDFPVGTETKFQWKECSVLLRSETEGFRIKDENGDVFYALLLDKGRIFFCPDERCSAHTVLSIMTGEMHNMEGENYG